MATASTPTSPLFASVRDLDRETQRDTLNTGNCAAPQRNVSRGHLVAVYVYNLGGMQTVGDAGGCRMTSGAKRAASPLRTKAALYLIQDVSVDPTPFEKVALACSPLTILTLATQTASSPGLTQCRSRSHR